jgi:hypothetical protein
MFFIKKRGKLLSSWVLVTLPLAPSLRNLTEKLGYVHNVSIDVVRLQSQNKGGIFSLLA